MPKKGLLARAVVPHSPLLGTFFTATTAAAMSNVVGQMVFSALPPLLVSSPETLSRVLGVQVVPCIAVAAAIWFGLPERPDSPPSASAALQWRERAAHAARHARSGPSVVLRQIVRDCSALLKNVNFALLACSFALGSACMKFCLF